MHSTSSREKRPSGVTCLCPMPRVCLAVVEDLVAAAQHAGDVGADLHVVLAGGLDAQHGVVTEDVADVEVEKIEARRQFRWTGGFGDVALTSSCA